MGDHQEGRQVVQQFLSLPGILFWIRLVRIAFQGKAAAANRWPYDWLCCTAGKNEVQNTAVIRGSINKGTDRCICGRE